ncbi:MAG: 2,3-bisphosphoglycerate-independent phosphoglycerate mutase [Parcubacteria group bacterium Athens1014_10]|nr:MAG: 2,3-bisphosphoglycerate-independent phosphoglycerate mutase [Parcubacteria group bacterium Athens1014_10]TSD05129.1 MAG: 2,3-bisphosphoglycerate-independent phosphoglycerate mutase [Parcubacteria group bacterium Athens0714_12]
MINQTKRPKPVALLILDGWGIAPPSKSNAIDLANTPNFDYLTKNYLSLSLQASGEAVGLPWGERGNSEVGHSNIGAGKIIYQTLPKINKTIWEGTFFKNETFLKAIEHSKINKSKLHLIGLISYGGIHSYIDHLYALLELAKKEKVGQIYIHAILDGRDTKYNEALNIINHLEERLKMTVMGKIATLSGRFYAMDRDQYWERTEKSYLAMAQGISEKKYENSRAAIEDSYGKKIFDENFIPAVIIDKNNQPIAKIEDDDAVIFFNFREDRARQLTKAFVLSNFESFKRPRYLQNLFFVTFVGYEEGLPAKTAFYFKEGLTTLSEIISQNGLKQLHIAETEKYAHVTYFFNNGKEKPHPNEKWLMIPSPRVPAYDQKPEMSARQIANKIIEEIEKDEYDFILANFANLDMIGHTGNLQAAIKAAEAIDECVEIIVKTILNKKGVAILTADHGNAEETMNLFTGEIDKEHSVNPVPFILIGKKWKKAKEEDVNLAALTPSGVLADIAPTILKIMSLEKPKEMTGISLI